jgi:RHS repeat-associated protein
MRLDHPGNGQAMGTYTERYVYDAVGNLLQVQHRGTDPAHPGWTRRYTYSETSLIEDIKKSNRMSSTRVGNGVASALEPYQHDAHGNMLRMPHLGGELAGVNMHWDYKDQFQQTDLGDGGKAFYVYDASGQRMRKVWEKAPGHIEERIYLSGFEIFRKHGGPVGANTATLERETLHVMDDKQRIALVETRTLDMAGTDQAPRKLIRYQLGNHLGSASLELNGQAQILSYEEYSPYGNSTYQATRSQVETAKRYRYSGKERDEESGLYYHGARQYAPWLSRWTSCDPSGIKDGQNVYSFVHNRPNDEVDPTGSDGQPWWRFTEAGFQYQTGRHDIFSTHPGYDTGFAPANFVVNLVVTASNICTIPFNAVTEIAAIPEETARWLGASEEDIAALNFALLMTGVGEVNAVPKMVRAARSVTEAIKVKNQATAATEVKNITTVASKSKNMVTAATEAKNLATGVKAGRILEEPAKLIKRMGGKGLRVDVGGAGSMKNAINLNPLTHEVSGGPATGVPNLIKDTFGNIGKYFKEGSVKELFSEKLRFVDIEKGLDAAVQGSYKVMEPGGKVFMNIWADKAQAQTLLEAFKRSGFKNVQVTGEGVGTIISALR